jgi:hypothetical protein
MKTEYTFEDVNAVRVYTRKYAKSVPSYKTVYKNTELHKPKVKLDVKVKEFSLLWGLIKFNY